MFSPDPHLLQRCHHGIACSQNVSVEVLRVLRWKYIQDISLIKKIKEKKSIHTIPTTFHANSEASDNDNVSSPFEGYLN